MRGQHKFADVTMMCKSGIINANTSLTTIQLVIRSMCPRIIKNSDNNFRYY